MDHRRQSDDQRSPSQASSSSADLTSRHKEEFPPPPPPMTERRGYQREERPRDRDHRKRDRERDDRRRKYPYGYERPAREPEKLRTRSPSPNPPPPPPSSSSLRTPTHHRTYSPGYASPLVSPNPNTPHLPPASPASGVYAPTPSSRRTAKPMKHAIHQMVQSVLHPQKARLEEIHGQLKKLKEDENKIIERAFKTKFEVELVQFDLAKLRNQLALSQSQLDKALDEFK